MTPELDQAAAVSDCVMSDLGRFAIVPDWVLRSSISDRAVRLFALLARYADRERHEAFPSRQTLAQALNASTDSVDRATKELVVIGAVQVEHRRNSSGDPTSNLYRLMYVKSDSEGSLSQSPGRITAATGSRTTAETVAAAMRHRRRTTVTRQRSSEEDLSAERAFDTQFWPAYPKKVGRKAALAAFRKLNPTDEFLTEMLAALKRQSTAWGTADLRFIPYPATWLTGERWLDEVVQRRPPSRRGAGLTGPAPPGKYDHLTVTDEDLPESGPSEGSDDKTTWPFEGSMPNPRKRNEGTVRGRIV